MGDFFLFSSTWVKMWSKGCPFENHENRKWHPKQTFYKSSALGPSKNCLGERFWKNYEKEIEQSIVFDGPKPLKSIEKQTFVLIFVHSEKNWKKDAKGTSKVMFGGPKWRHGPPRFDLSSDLLRLGAMPKNHHFWTPSRCTKKSRKSDRGAPKDRKSAPRYSTTPSFWAGGVPRINWK